MAVTRAVAGDGYLVRRADRSGPCPGCDSFTASALQITPRPYPSGIQDLAFAMHFLPDFLAGQVLARLL